MHVRCGAPTHFPANTSTNTTKTCSTWSARSTTSLNLRSRGSNTRARPRAANVDCDDKPENRSFFLQADCSYGVRSSTRVMLTRVSDFGERRCCIAFTFPIRSSPRQGQVHQIQSQSITWCGRTRPSGWETTAEQCQLSGQRQAIGMFAQLDDIRYQCPNANLHQSDKRIGSVSRGRSSQV